jgi:hypothetical protein
MMDDREWREMSKAEDELRKHVRERDKILAEATKSAVAKYVWPAVATIVGNHSYAIIEGMLSGSRQLVLKDHNKAIAEIYRKYPKLKALFDANEAHFAIAEIKEDPSGRVPATHHMKVRKVDGKFEVVDVNADGSVDQGYGKMSAERCWEFLRPCNRMVKSKDGWEHYWNTSWKMHDEKNKKDKKKKKLYFLLARNGACSSAETLSRTLVRITCRSWYKSESAELSAWTRGVVSRQ